MAISNHERVGKALELLKEGLRPFVEHANLSWVRSLPRIAMRPKIGKGGLPP
jgi:hypothetical protein